MNKWTFTKKRRADRFQSGGVTVSQGVIHRLRLTPHTTLQALHAAEGLHAWQVTDKKAEPHTYRIYLHGFDGTAALLDFAEQIARYVVKLAPKGTSESTLEELKTLIQLVYSMESKSLKGHYQRQALRAILSVRQINTTRDRNNQTPRLIHQAALCAKLALQAHNETLAEPRALPDFNLILEATLLDHMMRGPQT